MSTGTPGTGQISAGAGDSVDRPKPPAPEVRNTARSRRRLGLAAGLLVVAVLLLLRLLPDTGGAKVNPAAEPAEAEFRPPFSPTSAFNTPIGPNVRLDPKSAAMVRVLAGKGHATAQVYDDTPSVYYADVSTPRYA